MNQPHIVWDLEDDPDGNVQHLAEHDLSVDEVEEVLLARKSQTTRSRSSGERITFGYTGEGRYLAVVWQHVLDDPADHGIRRPRTPTAKKEKTNGQSSHKSKTRSQSD
jgi:hypothetical protein